MPINPKKKVNRKNSAYPIKEETRKLILEEVSKKFDEEE